MHVEHQESVDRYLPDQVSMIHSVMGRQIHFVDSRLDFVNFVIANPSQTAGTATQCMTDAFTVTGQTNNVPAICGTNTNQHSKSSSSKWPTYGSRGDRG